MVGWHYECIGYPWLVYWPVSCGGIFGLNDYQEIGDEVTGARSSPHHDDFVNENGLLLVSRPFNTAVPTNGGVFADEPQRHMDFPNTGAGPHVLPYHQL